MRSVIYDTVVLSAPADTLFAMYLDPEKHAAITGKPVEIGAETGDKFQAFEGVLTGTILKVVRSRLIVQSWRSALFRAEDPDSTLILCFSQQEDAGKINLVHLDVPDHDFDDVVAGWEKYYWTPWREYLSRNSSS